MSRRYHLVTIELRDAQAFVALHHRHHTPPVGHKFSIAAESDCAIVGVAIIGRPVARGRQDGKTLEVTRLCVRDGVPDVVDRFGKVHAHGVDSFLYGAAARATFALGYRRIGTYILRSELGTSLVAAGWKLIAETRGGGWSCNVRKRDDTGPLEPKKLFELEAA